MSIDGREGPVYGERFNLLNNFTILISRINFQVNLNVTKLLTDFNIFIPEYLLLTYKKAFNAYFAVDFRF